MSRLFFKFAAFSLVFCLISPSLTVTAADLSDYQRASISQNCATIKQSLKSLQYADSKTRLALGSTYQSILVDFITPLNLRLVKENHPDSDLNQFQANFAAAKDLFSSSFIKYSQGLEELLNTNCQSDPDLFYLRLETTRSLRASTKSAVDSLDKLFRDHLQIILNFKSKALVNE